jgi:hypothetical protein
MKENSADFSKVMNGWVAKTKAEKLRFNYDKLGASGLLNMLARVGKHKFVERGLHRKSTRTLLIENNAKLDSIHWRLSELERMIESGFILQEQRIAEIKNRLKRLNKQKWALCGSIRLFSFNLLRFYDYGIKRGRFHWGPMSF